MSEMSEIDVAVIVVTYKSAQLSIDCLRSIDVERRSGWPRIRCVVVDNASGDAPAIAEAIATEGWGDWARVVTAQRNGGFAYGNNVGLREVEQAGKPDYVHLLNPDTVLQPGAISALIRFMDARPNVGVAGGIFENADRSEWAIAFRFPSVIGEVVRGLQLGLATRLLRQWEVPINMGREARQVDWVSGASMMVRADVFEKIGRLDEGFFLYFEETEFCFRAKQAGLEVWYVPESRVIHIAGQSTKVTERKQSPRRLPSYWFASRRRYFVVTRGRAYAVIADVAAVFAGALGCAKRTLQMRTGSDVPYFLRDVIAHSPLWARNARADLNPPGRSGA